MHLAGPGDAGAERPVHGGDVDVGIGLVVAAVPVFPAMSLLPECLRWSERALFALDETTRGAAEEMHLQVCVGTASLYMHGQNEAAREALVKSLAIAEARGDGLNRVGLRSLLHMFHFRGGEFRAAMQNATQCRAIAAAVEEQGGSTSEIARSVQQAAQGTQGVMQNIAGVTQASGQVGTAAELVLGSAGELAKQSERLKQEVESFLATVRAA